MTDRLADIEARAEKATKGPWVEVGRDVDHGHPHSCRGPFDPCLPRWRGWSEEIGDGEAEAGEDIFAVERVVGRELLSRTVRMAHLDRSLERVDYPGEAGTGSQVGLDQFVILLVEPLPSDLVHG